MLPAIAVLFLQLAGCGDGSADDPSRSEATPTDASTPTHHGDGHNWALLLDQTGGMPLAPGDYGLTPNGVSDTIVVVTVPEGFMGYGGWTFVTDSPFRAMGYQTAERVYGDPCGLARDDKNGTLRDPGPTVADLAKALVAQRGTRTSKPVRVTVDGHHGLYLDYQVSKGIDPGECQNQAFDIFDTGPGSWYLEEPRERAGIWIVDVEGERLVLAWVAVPGVTEAEIQEMAHMVETARFVDAD
jgi:hypothetical protein